MRMEREGERVDVYLSRRNIEALLAKLDGHPPHSSLTLVGGAGAEDLTVVAEENDMHYAHDARGEMRGTPGKLHSETEAQLLASPGPDGLLVPTPEGDIYIDGTGQHVLGVHAPDDCEGRPCVIHRPSDHSMRAFPTHFRFDRYLMERICPHGVGHPDPDDLAFKLLEGRGEAEGVHGCDGCCGLER